MYKVEILIGKMLERGASFLNFSGNMKKWRQHGKVDTTLDQNILCSSKMQHEREGTNLRIIIWEMNIYEFS